MNIETIRNSTLKLSLIFFILFSNSFLYSQTPWCSSAERHADMLQKNPQVASEFQKLMNGLKSHTQNPASQKRAIITIPVVVHVIHNGDSIGSGENISEDQILSQLEVLNTDFRKRNADTTDIPGIFKPLAADFEIEFCLAQRDPNNFPTTGINRINGLRNTWDINLADQLKAATIWDPNRYLNIWVMSLGGSSASTLGYAQFPWMPDTTDGIVIDYKAFGTFGDLLPSSNRGRTTTHEVGHWLGLFHTWGDNSDCITDDNVSDTPIQATENYGCPSFPHVSCNNGPNGDMFMNYMDYSNDACSNIFTHGQKAVVDYFFINSQKRKNILTSDACIPTTANERDIAIIELLLPSAEVCSDNFSPSVRVVNLGSAKIKSAVINYQFNSGILQQYFWIGNIETYHEAIINLPLQTLPLGDHQFFLEFVNVNGGNDQSNGNNIAEIDFTITSAGIGKAIPVHETFEDLNLPSLWQLLNPHNDRTWKIDTFSGSASNASVMFDNFSTAGVTPKNKRDGLITDEYDLRALARPQVAFDVAYAKRVPQVNDSLILYYSLDCGYRWKRFWAKGGAALATASERAVAFIPSPNDWRQEGADLFAAQGHPKVKFMFENFSDGGNNIYIDNFRIIESTTTAVADPAEDFPFEVYPNPANEILYVNAKPHLSENFQLTLFHISGKKVLEISEPVGHFQKADVSGLPPGFYLLHLKTEKQHFTRRVILH